jgi:TetR/AcrR family transcriptional regulator, regulator of cefoperazone and chloramphenicol sensitivity
VNAPAPDDLTARARIRQSAFEMIARQGVRSMTLRAIAGAAGVSPALVIHHYGSKQGVVEAVKEWVQALLRSSTADEGGSRDPAEANARRSAAFEQLLTETPLLRSYIRRMLLEESPEGLDWFARIVDDGAHDLRRRERKGMARRSQDVEAVAAILNVIALGPLLLPQHLDHVLGGDASQEALTRWRAATSELLRSALYPEATPVKGGKGVRSNKKKKAD